VLAPESRDLLLAGLELRLVYSKGVYSKGVYSKGLNVTKESEGPKALQ